MAFSQQFLLAVDAGEPHENVVAFSVAAIAQRHAPALGKDAQHVLEAVGRGDGPAGEADDLVVVAQPAAIGVGGVENIGDDDAAVGVGTDAGAERGVIDDPAAVEHAEEVLDLVDRNGVCPRRRSRGRVSRTSSGR